jgi:hypothetical protein
LSREKVDAVIVGAAYRGVGAHELAHAVPRIVLFERGPQLVKDFQLHPSATRLFSPEARSSPRSVDESCALFVTAVLTTPHWVCRAKGITPTSAD